MVKLVTAPIFSIQIPGSLLWLAYSAILIMSPETAFGNPDSSLGSGAESSTVLLEAKSLEGDASERRWTIRCEREDGTQGIFRISSDLREEVSSWDIPSKLDTPQDFQPPPEPTNPASPPPSEHVDEDPFGTPALKCGRLLTLLEIFATPEFPAP